MALFAVKKYCEFSVVLTFPFFLLQILSIFNKI